MASIDQVTLSTVWYGFQSLCREMRTMLTRTSQSYLISTLKDLSVGVWLADGSTVAVRGKKNINPAPNPGRPDGPLQSGA